MLGVFLERRETEAHPKHPAEQIGRELRALQDDETGPAVDYDRKALLPDDDFTALRYEGSLTTGLCEEVVKWFVFETPDTVSGNFGHLEPARAVQAPNRRYAIRGEILRGPAAPAP